MKLESLKSSKFEAFKADEITNPLLVIGGWMEHTTCDGGGDTWYHGGETPSNTHGTGGGGEITFGSPVVRPHGSTYIQTIINGGSNVSSLSSPDVNVFNQMANSQVVAITKNNPVYAIQTISQ